MKQFGLLKNNTIVDICKNIKLNDSGFRVTPGTSLINQQTNEVVYQPPQSYDEIVSYMDNLERFINDNEISDLILSLNGHYSSSIWVFILLVMAMDVLAYCQRFVSHAARFVWYSDIVFEQVYH